PLCRSGLTTLTMARRPGEVGFIFTSGISDLHREVDFLARLQADVCLLGVIAAPGITAEALDLALRIDDLDAVDLDLEQQFDRRLDLRLGRVARDLEDHLL